LATAQGTAGEGGAKGSAVSLRDRVEEGGGRPALRMLRGVRRSLPLLAPHLPPPGAAMHVLFACRTKPESQASQALDEPWAHEAQLATAQGTAGEGGAKGSAVSLRDTVEEGGGRPALRMLRGVRRSLPLLAPHLPPPGAAMHALFACRTKPESQASQALDEP
jgi:hypothetical protein